VDQEQDGILPFKADDGESAVPLWDVLNRKLYFGGKLVKAFTSPANYQEAILAGFEAQGWPIAIEAPRQGQTDARHHVCLERAVRRLNGNQRTRLLSFHVRASGKNVTWEQILEKSSVAEVMRFQRDTRD
jgi:hypothetical protein